MNNKTTPILVVLLVVAAFLIGMFWTKVQYLEKGSGTAKTSPQPSAAAQQQQPTVTIDQVRNAFNKSLIKFGKADNKLVFLEISDPSCPYCQIASGQNSKLNTQAGDRFKLVADGGTYVAPVPEMEKLVKANKASFALLYYPGHGNGEMGMKALYCAFENGKFWEAEKLLMTNDGYNLMNDTVKNDKTKSGDVADFLKTAVDPTKMKSCLDSGKYDSLFQSESALGQTLGIQGTPGFYVNATNFAGAYSWKDIEPTVTPLLK